MSSALGRSPNTASIAARSNGGGAPASTAGVSFRGLVTAPLVDYVMSRLAEDRVPLGRRDHAYAEAVAFEKHYWDTAQQIYGQVPVHWVNEATMTAVRMYAVFVTAGIELPTEAARESLAYTAVHAASSLIDAIDPEALVGRLGMCARKADSRN